MVSDITRNRFAAQLTEDNLPIARTIESRLKYRYPWVAAEDLHSYSLWGLLLAANAYSPPNRVPFPTFALWKATFLAVDQMRKERVLRRKPPNGQSPGPRQYSLTTDMADKRFPGPTRAMETRDYVRSALLHLVAKDRQLLLMYYCDDMTLREIGCALHVSEATACLRRKALITRLRQESQASQAKHEGGMS